MITASVGVNSSLLLEPAHQLTFWLDAQNQSPNESTDGGEFARATLKLTNISTHKLAVFKVRTNNADMFTVKPVHGVIAPGEAREIAITVVAASAARLAAMDAKELALRDSERFLIQSVERAEDMRGFDVSDLVAFWKRVPRELASNSKIGCRFAMLPSGGCASAAPLVLRMDTISKSPQPAIRKQLVPLPAEPEQTPDDQRLSAVQIRDIDRTIDVRDAHRRRSSSEQEKPVAFESSSSSEITDNGDNNPTTKAPQAKSAPTKALFSIHPSDTVEFTVSSEPGSTTLNPATFFLTNKSRSHALAFKVKTTNHEGYFVKPSRGLIGPSNAQPIEILPVSQDSMLVPDDAATLTELAQREEKDRFMVEIVRVDIAVYQELLSLDEQVRKHDLVRVWDSAAPSCRDKAMLNCRIADPPLTKKNLMNLQAKNNQADHDMWC